MKRLLDFLLRYHYLLLFILLELLSLSFVIRFNNYQRVRFFNSSNSISGRIYERSANIGDYFKLQKINDKLAAENANLRSKIQSIKESDIYLQAHGPIDSNIVHSIPAKVINNSINKLNNYITLNKGYKDGVKQDMGVISPDGIVGVVVNVSRNYSTVLSVLNEKWSINSKLLKTNNFGSLRWDGKDSRVAILNDIPYHVVVAVDDTIVTSGLSTIFPEGIMIGKALKIEHNQGDNFQKVWVQLSTDFNSLDYVEVIKNEVYKEKIELEKLTDTEENE